MTRQSKVLYLEEATQEPYELYVKGGGEIGNLRYACNDFMEFLAS